MSSLKALLLVSLILFEIGSCMPSNDPPASSGNLVDTLGSFGYDLFMTGRLQDKSNKVCIPLKNNLLDIGLAMHGYDPFKADGTAKEGNPGFMNGEIFDYHCNRGKGYLNFISLRSDLNCEASMDTKAYRTVKEYSQATSQSSSSQLGASLKITAKYFGFKSEASAKYATSRNGNSSAAIQALMNGSGEVFLTTAECFTHDVSVDTYSRLRFTPNFINGLEALSATLSLSEEKQVTEFARFVKTFGTHFIRKAEMGASLTYEKIYQAKSKSLAAQMTKAECLSKAAEGCLSASGGTIVSVSAKACINGNVTQCQKDAKSAQSEIEDTDNSVSIVSRGSRPKGLTDWVNSEFKPIPVKIHSEPIITLLTARNLAASEDYGIANTLDHAALRNLFLMGYRRYCTNILGLSQQLCQRELTGCGQIGDCDFGQTCENRPNEPNGYRCVTKDPNRPKYCHSKFLGGNPDGNEKLFRNANLDTCVQMCVRAGGTYVTVNRGIDFSNTIYSCICKTGTVTKTNGNNLHGHYKQYAAVGLCDGCYGKFQIGDPTGSRQELVSGKTVKECAKYCKSRGATYITIANNGVDPSAFTGNCYCEYGTIYSWFDRTKIGFRTAPLLDKC